MNQEVAVNYHKPYCPRCREYVRPQVVSSTIVRGGSGYVSNGFGSSGSFTSEVFYTKFCPACGEAVTSQADDEERERKQIAENATGQTLHFTLALCSPLLVPCLGPIPGFLGMIAAAGYKPKLLQGWLALALYFCSFVLGVLYVAWYLYTYGRPGA